MTTATTEAITPLNLTAAEFDPTRHNGMVTITSPTGAHRTFSIKTVKSGGLEGKRVVSLLIGPDRDDPADWRGFGFADGFGVKVWAKCKGAAGDRSDFERFASMLEDPRKFEARGCGYLIEASCRRCNRPLTRPDSITDGYGAECRRKIGGGL